MKQFAFILEFVLVLVATIVVAVFLATNFCFTGLLFVLPIIGLWVIVYFTHEILFD